MQQTPSLPLPSSSGADTTEPSGTDAFRLVTEALQAHGRARVSGLKGGARGYVLAELSRRTGKPLLCVTEDDEAAEHLASDLAFFLGGEGTPTEPTVLVLPADEVLPYDEVTADGAVVTQRLSTLFHLRRGSRFQALVLSMRALRKKVLPPEVMASLSEVVRVGEELGRDRLARKLADMGYLPTPLVEDVGTFSVRGDIIDVYPPLSQRPLRLELFGDTLESIRAFDPETQRTTDAQDALQLLPARELILSESRRPLAEAALRAAGERLNLPTLKLRERLEQVREGFHAVGLEAVLPALYEGGLKPVFDYLPFWHSSPLVWLDDPLALERVGAELTEEIQASFASAEADQELTLPPEHHFVDPAELQRTLEGFVRIEGGGLTLGEVTSPPLSFSFGSTKDLREAIVSHHGEEGALTPLMERLGRWRDMGLATLIACGSQGQADRLRRLLLDRNTAVQVHAEPLSEWASLKNPSVWAHLFIGDLSSGFVDVRGGLAVLTDEEILGTRVRRKARARKAATPFAAAFGDLKEGDLVVHTDFGIARYSGLTQMDVRGVPGDFLVLEYAGKDKVYLPVSRMRLIQKFTGGDPESVALDKLGSGSWEKTKKRVKENLLKMAADLLSVFAARKAHPGFSFSAPDRFFRQFEADFEFDETPDQAKAIEDVLADMQKPVPMDRLVCGDVGYGKTEVAMRAAFKAVLDRKQVGVLVPTTVLAQQHYESFKKRFKDYPVTIEVVSGMRKPGEVREILRRTKEGKIDILLGTHKLLASSVSFANLGLLIVDEEQRFGVKQKEALKRFRTQVDVLTLTATPIPRTLNMAMSGVRDLSIIATPPQDRRAIRTFVLKFDEHTIREAVLREVQRGGQVFFVHNRIESIQAMEQRLRELVPEVSIGVAHGQMGEGQLEKVMADFIARKFQLLLCTSIIESGIDISSANTMIVDRADQFGLAQLYQLRGRVGRSKERAYAYLLVPKGRAMTKDAQRRLEVLQNFTELGAGFSIASHDLEIRGAGNLLGGEQSGAIAAIGFDLYAQLLDEAIHEMRGEPLRETVEPDVTLPVPAIIPDDYVPDVHQRLMFYKRFSMASTPDELSDLRAELVDRFGEAPDEVDNLTELMHLKIQMRDLRLRSLDTGAGRLVVSLGPDAAIDGVRLAGLVQRSGGVYRLTPDMKLVAKVPDGLRDGDVVVEAKKVLRDLSACGVVAH